MKTNINEILHNSHYGELTYSQKERIKSEIFLIYKQKLNFFKLSLSYNDLGIFIQVNFHNEYR